MGIVRTFRIKTYISNTFSEFKKKKKKKKRQSAGEKKKNNPRFGIHILIMPFRS